MTTPHDPHAIVEFAGRRFDSWQDGHGLLGVEVELTTGEASQCQVGVADPAPGFAFVNSITTEEGVSESVARVWLGFGTDLGTPVFEGLLGRVDYEGGRTTLGLFDAGLRMRKVQRTEYHRGLTDLGVIEKLARRNGLLFAGPEAAVALDKHKSLKQEAATDWALALECAERAGLVVFVRANKLYVKEAAKTAQVPLITLAYAEDFILTEGFHLGFRVPENQEGRPAKVETRGRGRGGRRLRGDAEAHQRGTEKIELKRDLRVKTKRHADKRAEARKALQREHAFTGSVGVLPSFSGARPDVRSTVALSRLPRLFNGKWIADRVSHVFEPGELSMELDLYRDLKA